MTLFRLFTQVLNVAGTILILLMALSVNLDVGGRNLFNKPIAGVNEFIGLSIVAVVFLQMANTLQEDRHVSNDIFIRLIQGTHPRLSAAIYSAFQIVGVMLMAIIVGVAIGALAGRVGIAEDGLTLSKDKDKKDPASKAVQLGKASGKFETGKWHTLQLETKGGKVLVQPDNGAKVEGSHAELDVDKTGYRFVLKGESVRITDVKVWLAEK